MHFILLTLFLVCSSFAEAAQDERLPNKCEVCKFLTVELQASLEKTGRSKEVLELGEGASQTMTTLKNLVHKGVKVDLGLPYELWDEPSVEVSDMKKQDQRLERFLCETHVLSGSELECLEEVWKGDLGSKAESEETTTATATSGEKTTSHDAGEL
ncbi:hypothetical protein CRUP_027364 [Coryphaenoides rupestris]|nr:hypothetical protein CRUP_027364 [Coryphaenoides rupestris]